MNVDPLIAGLNEEQKNAVIAPHTNHILILAGAGCGKTTVLTRRIAYLTLSVCKQEKILALTFTRKAAEEMLSRVSLLESIDQSRSLPVITTFHGFALRLLSEIHNGMTNFQRIGYRKQPELITGSHRLKILASLTSAAERNILGADLLKLDSMLEQKSVFPDKLGDMDENQLRILERIETRLQTQKQEDNVWDFSDLISGALRLLQEHRSFRSRCAELFDAILVDEFQDTNPMQINLLNLLLGEGKQLFAVGDDDQAIYGFRGADIRPTLNFSDYFKNAIILKLQTNYRSIPPILYTANKIFRSKPSQYRKVLVSGRYHGKSNYPRPSKHLFGDQREMADWIMQKAVVISSKEAVAINEMVILFRANQSLNWVAEYLKQKYSTISSPQLMTIHKSKGLEFPVVFLCDLEDGVFPGYRVSARGDGKFADLFRWLLKRKDRSSETDWGEEMRIFYVGVTRAQRFLYFLSAKNKLLYGRKRRFERSRFLRLI